MSAAGMSTAAALAAAAVVFTVMGMVIAHDVGIVGKLPCQQSGNRVIRPSGYAAVEPDPGRGQCRLGTAADSAADQNVGVQGGEHPCQRAVSAAVGADHLGSDDLSVRRIIDLKLFGVSKMLEDISVIVGDCNSHNLFSFRLFVLLMVLLLEACQTAGTALSGAKAEFGAREEGSEVLKRHAITRILGRLTIDRSDVTQNEKLIALFRRTDSALHRVTWAETKLLDLLLGNEAIVGRSDVVIV